MQESKRQLKMIAELQRHFLPRQLPEPVGWRLAGYYAPGHWPGGACYDFFSFPDGRVFLLVADASDQGAPAVALTAMLHVVLHSCPMSTGVERLPFCPVHDPLMQPPHIVLGHLNTVLAENSLPEQFVSAFCGVLNPADGCFHYANAGQPPPRWWHASSGLLEPLREAAGLPLGLNRHATYHQRRLRLEPGDLLVLYSNGLPGAEHDGQIFSSERLDNLIRAAAPHGAAAVKTGVLDELEGFLASADNSDDIVLLVVEREG